MRPPNVFPVRVCVFVLGIMMVVLLGFALERKGEVKARLRVLGIELSLDTKDHPVRPEE